MNQLGVCTVKMSLFINIIATSENDVNEQEKIYFIHIYNLMHWIDDMHDYFIGITVISYLRNRLLF